MDTYTIRRVPWTCRWGRFGVSVDDTGMASRVDDVFWVCHQPDWAPESRLTRRGECDLCPFWEVAPRLHSESRT
jgi:hypothetical protein